MMFCLTCGLRKPNKYKSYNCPHCNSYLKYVEAPAKGTVIKLHKAGLSVSYATAEVYSYNNCTVHTVNICIGMAHPYQATVFRELPYGVGYVLPHSHEHINHTPKDHILYPVHTYGLIRYEIPYLDLKEARKVLKQKLKEMNDWVDEASESGWLAILNLGGLL